MSLTKINIAYSICLSSVAISGILTYWLVILTKVAYEGDIFTELIISHGVLSFVLLDIIRIVMVISFFRIIKSSQLNNIRKITTILFTFMFAIDMINDIAWTIVLFI